MIHVISGDDPGMRQAAANELMGMIDSENRGIRRITSDIGRGGSRRSLESGRSSAQKGHGGDEGAAYSRPPVDRILSNVGEAECESGIELVPGGGMAIKHDEVDIEGIEEWDAGALQLVFYDDLLVNRIQVSPHLMQFEALF